jgi:nickel-dependent lactate racemase
VAVVIPDITRPMPTGRLLGWLFEELSHVADKRITIISGTGSHRANTERELISMLGEPIVARYRIVNHSAHDPATLAHAGTASDGRAISLCRQYVEADRRIVLGFIEPHFMAGFSGGYKGVFPALADIDSIMHYHRAAVIGDPKSTWGNLEDNPTQAIVRQYGSVLPVDFLINVTQNKQRGITGFFCGEPLAAHRAGAAFAKTTAMAACARSYPIVVTSNAGYPLDQNLYQTVKGMSAAAQIVEPSGYILTASECCDGFPAHGNFKRLLFDHQSPSHVLDTILSPGFSLFDQWEAQILAMIAQKAHLGLYSSLAPAEVRRAYIEPIHDITERLSEELGRRGSEAPIAVLPEGPMTIPYLGNA